MVGRVRQTHLALKIDRSGASQIAFIVSLLHRRRRRLTQIHVGRPLQMSDTMPCSETVGGWSSALGEVGVDHGRMIAATVTVAGPPRPRWWMAEPHFPLSQVKGDVGLGWFRRATRPGRRANMRHTIRRLITAEAPAQNSDLVTSHPRSVQSLVLLGDEGVAGGSGQCAAS